MHRDSEKVKFSQLVHTPTKIEQLVAFQIFFWSNEAVYEHEFCFPKGYNNKVNLLWPVFENSLKLNKINFKLI